MIVTSKLRLCFAFLIGCSASLSYAQSLDLTGLLNQTESDFNQGIKDGEQLERDAARRAAERSRNNNIRCISVSGDFTCLDCIAEDINISGGPGYIDNTWSSPSICTGYNGLEGSYNYTMRSNFDTVCSGTFQVTSKAQSGVTINVYDTCNLSYVSEY
ncbi:hypothetical protein [Rhodalgimonas zhirmunskyi]|uniref:Uncharacterized protein n=1 Tax=Rhodalgimonas zhirmunskyi TaxID=2964767 RepID=A0AAJ1U5F2_9RHOB|nr:hypothetical protein [Rhodoalgimonas zhirmunskyi]MDQ2093955.1 hypothetical protein [Rhodoalgimonas zhirmunskyi]